jgi:two-component system sensor histidine kinase KdpD
MAINSLALRGRQLLETGKLEHAAALRSILHSLALVAMITICLIVVSRATQLPHVSIMYLVPVLVAATRWGAIPAIAAAIGGVAASAFFFYPPVYDLRVSNPQQIMDLALFVGVAVVTGHLADSVRVHMKAAQKSESEVRALYAFSRRLAVASAVEEILAAAREHLSAVLGHRVLLFQTRSTEEAPELIGGAEGVPDAVRTKISQVGQSMQRAALCVDDVTGSMWLVRAVSPSNPALGMVAMDLGRYPADQLEPLRQQVDTALADASATLERLDVARALVEARARSSRETFREALIGSVTHELRTPLAAILGAVSVLSQSRPVAEDKGLAELADIVRSEAEHLDSDIQKLLDASRISSDGLQPHPAWTDPADLINAALEPYRRAVGGQRIHMRVSDDLPLVHVDPVLIGRALRQIIDNAVKYSPAGSAITIDAEDLGGRLAIRVHDMGMGLTAEEKARLFERFYRSPRHQAAAPGSGLGLWIARAFLRSGNGQLVVESAGRDQGTTVALYLPAPSAPGRGTQDDSDE